MFTAFIAALRQRHALRQSVASILRRSDDHLLDDIGLTRDDVLRLIEAPRLAQSPNPVLAKPVLAWTKKVAAFA